jgi:hypothetical protein
MLHDTCLETSKQDIITWCCAGCFFVISTLKANHATNFKKVLLLPKMSTFGMINLSNLDVLETDLDLRSEIKELRIEGF